MSLSEDKVRHIAKSSSPASRGRRPRSGRRGHGSDPSASCPPHQAATSPLPPLRGRRESCSTLLLFAPFRFPEDDRTVEISRISMNINLVFNHEWLRFRSIKLVTSIFIIPIFLFGCGPSMRFSYVAVGGAMSHLLNSQMLWTGVYNKATGAVETRCPSIKGLDKNASETVSGIRSLMNDGSGKIKKAVDLENIGFYCVNLDHKICRYRDDIFIKKVGFSKSEDNGNFHYVIEICADLNSDPKPIIYSSIARSE